MPAGFACQVKRIPADQPPFQSAAAALAGVQYHITHSSEHTGIPRKVITRSRIYLLLGEYLDGTSNAMKDHQLWLTISCRLQLSGILYWPEDYPGRQGVTARL